MGSPAAWHFASRWLGPLVPKHERATARSGSFSSAIGKQPSGCCCPDVPRTRSGGGICISTCDSADAAYPRRWATITSGRTISVRVGTIARNRRSASIKVIGAEPCVAAIAIRSSASSCAGAVGPVAESCDPGTISFVIYVAVRGGRLIRSNST